MAITLWTTVRLMRSVWVSSARRCLTALGTSRPVRGSSSTMNPRSACTKIVNRLSSSFGKTSASPRAFPKFWLISNRAFSLASVFTSSRRPVEPVLTANFDMIVEVPGGRSSSTIVTAGAGSRRWPAGGVTARSAGPRWKANEQVADAHLVVLAEQLPPGDRPAVQQRAVAAVEVLDVEGAVDAEHAGVLAADGARFEHDIAGGVPAEDDGRPFQGECSPGLGPCTA